MAALVAQPISLDADPHDAKIFVGGLSRETTTTGLRVYFERFGDIADCVVIKDRSTGAPRGFGFVTYASQVTAHRVVQHRHVIDGKEVEAKPAVPRDSEVLTRPPPGAGGIVAQAQGVGPGPGLLQPSQQGNQQGTNKENS